MYAKSNGAVEIVYKWMLTEFQKKVYMKVIKGIEIDVSELGTLQYASETHASAARTSG